MSRAPIDGRRHVSTLEALVEREGDSFVLRAPRPGYFRPAVGAGAVLEEGARLGELEVLGALHRLLVPAGAFGAVALPGGPVLAHRPVAYAATLVTLDPALLARSTGAEGDGPRSDAAAGALVFRTPLGGRYYARPTPTAEPFIRVGDVVRAGQTIALFEVMKTFNRVSYGGPGLPPEGRIRRIFPNDGDDVNAGDMLVELE